MSNREEINCNIYCADSDSPLFLEKVWLSLVDVFFVLWDSQFSQATLVKNLFRS